MNAIYIAVILTCAIFILVGHFGPSTSEFYRGTGNYGPIVSAISIVAAFTGGGALINTTALASKYGHWAFFDVFPAVIGLLFSAVLVWAGLFGKRFSDAFFNIDSAVYDKKAVGVHYAQVAFLYTLVIAAQFRAVATVADQLGIPAWTAVLLCAVTVAVYAFKGFDAVTRTDIWQLLLMLPMYIVLAVLASEPSAPMTPIAPVVHDEMPIPLVIALCLPLLFLPISQEIHQRGAAVTTDAIISLSYIVAGFVYAILGCALVILFSNNQHLGLAKIIGGTNVIAAMFVAIGILSAILSTLDTCTNIASHALQKLPPFARLHPALAQALLLALGASLFLYFKTVLSLILFALFLYMAGPALTFVGVFVGIHPRSCAITGSLFVTLQAFFQFKGDRLPMDGLIAKSIPLSDPIQMGILLLLLQSSFLAVLALRRRYL